MFFQNEYSKQKHYVPLKRSRKMIEGSTYWHRFWRCMQWWPGEWTTVYHPICFECHLPMPWGGAWLEDTERVYVKQHILDANCCHTCCFANSN